MYKPVREPSYTREITMLKTKQTTIVTGFVLAMATLSFPAAATQTSKALSICVSRGTACTVTNKKDGYEFASITLVAANVCTVPR